MKHTPASSPNPSPLGSTRYGRKAKDVKSNFKPLSNTIRQTPDSGLGPERVVGQRGTTDFSCLDVFSWSSAYILPPTFVLASRNLVHDCLETAAHGRRQKLGESGERMCCFIEDFKLCFYGTDTNTCV